MEIRVAEPTSVDGLAYARFLNLAADGFFDFMLGKKYVDIIADIFATPAHDFSYQNAIFAEQDGQIVGMASGFTAAQHHRCSDQVLTKAKEFPAFRMFLIHIAFGSLWRFLDSIKEGDFYLQAVAVTPELHGRGVGSMLIQSMEATAIERDSKRFVLDVASKNENAQRLYLRRGMSVEAMWPKRFSLVNFRVLRMIKPLETTRHAD